MAQPKPLIFTERANEKLLDILIYAEETYSYHRAEKISRSFEEAFSRIEKTPDSFLRFEERIFPDVILRELIVEKTYRIIYQVLPQNTIILDIYHTSRNLDDLWINLYPLK